MLYEYVKTYKRILRITSNTGLNWITSYGLMKQMWGDMLSSLILGKFTEGTNWNRKKIYDIITASRHCSEDG